MGKDLKLQELQGRKEALLQEMAEGIEAWNGHWESGILLIDENEKKIQELKVLNDGLKSRKIPSESPGPEEEKLRRITEGLEMVIREILRQKEEILLEKTKMEKHGDLESRYLKGRGKSRFIDKKI